MNIVSDINRTEEYLKRPLLSDFLPDSVHHLVKIYEFDADDKNGWKWFRRFDRL